MSKQKLPVYATYNPETQCTYCSSKKSGLIIESSKGKMVYICPDCLIKVLNKILK